MSKKISQCGLPQSASLWILGVGGILLNQVGNALATFLGPVVLMESEGAELLDVKEA